MSVRVGTRHVALVLAAGQPVRAPRHSFPLAVVASPAERRARRIGLDGANVRWPALDEDSSASGIAHPAAAPRLSRWAFREALRRRAVARSRDSRHTLAHDERPGASALLGPTLLDSLAGTGPGTAKGAARLRCLAQLVDDLAESHNAASVRRWFARLRPRLDDLEAEGPSVRQFAAALWRVDVAREKVAYSSRAGSASGAALDDSGTAAFTRP